MADNRAGRVDGRHLRTAVIGTGFVGPHHVDAVRRTGYADVDVLVGSDPDRTARRAQELGVAQWSTDVDAVLGDARIDVVHVCTPNNTHVRLARAALEAGKHLVLEKPIALDSAGAKELVDVAARAGRHAMVALTYRGYPMVRRARKVVEDGELGEIRLVHGGYLQDWLADAGDYNWRVDPAVGGQSRAVADIGTHWFDTAEFVTGLRVEAVLADFATFMPTRMRAGGASVAFSPAEGPMEPVRVESEDAATILLRFEGGVRGTSVVSQVSTGRKNALSLNVDGATRSLTWEQEAPERLWLRERDEARLLVRSQEPTQARSGIPSLPAGHPEGWGEALRDLLRPFYASVAAESPPTADEVAYPTLRAGARSIAFVEAAVASSASGAWVPCLTMSDAKALTVECQSEESGWRCTVIVGTDPRASRHEVTVSREDLARLVPAGITVERLVEASFEFLLAREPRESILRSFDLPVISRYFPDYEREIRLRLGS